MSDCPDLAYIYRIRHVDPPLLLQGFMRPGRITDREDDYRKRRLARMLSPARNDAFAMGDRTPANDVRTYGDVLRENQLARETENTMRYCF